MLDRRQSLQRILRARRPGTTSAKQRKRSVHRNVKRVTSGPSVAIDSFVEDSQDSVPQYSVRKPSRRRARIGSDKGSAKSSGLPESAVDGVESERDAEEDKYNLLESTEELELPCRLESVDEMTVCGELGADVPVVPESSSHVVSDVVNVSGAAAATVCEQSSVVENQPIIARRSSFQTPQPQSPPLLAESDAKQAVSDERPATHSCPRRLSSLPTQQLDGQLDTPPTATNKQSSVVSKVSFQ